MASAMLLAIVAMSLVVSSQANAYLGGATSVANLMASLGPNSRSGVGAYVSVGSGQGIACFSGTAACVSGRFGVGFSDDPMTATQDAQAGAKFTIPLCLGTYSFATKKAPGLAIKACTAALIFSGHSVKWSAIKAGLSGNVVAVARADGSGTTELFGKYLRLACPSVWPATKTGTAAWGYTTQRTGSDGVASFVKSTPNSIGYLQSGIAKTTYGLYLMGLQNKAGKFPFATGADPAQAVPRILPSSAASWASVSLLLNAGAATYPVESFVYMFAHKRYTSASQYKVLKAWLKYSQSSSAQNLMRNYFFWNLPSKVTAQGLGAIAKITA
eukprot:TRINITY_DN22072_c0_g1_i1.p1 TRINITY_DN22072_c0_g1~~TRINITY_DN22072_c0_g1_i1.p1  ORF type:complete len:328 (+),score=40.37 TRINITY_DN22072_c0_g1_i1:216-1199(+)